MLKIENVAVVFVLVVTVLCLANESSKLLGQTHKKLVIFFIGYNEPKQSFEAIMVSTQEASKIHDAYFVWQTCKKLEALHSAK